MADAASDHTSHERRVLQRYRVDLKTVAVRPAKPLPINVPTRVPITIVDISQTGVGWRSKHLFYRGELVGLRLETDDDRDLNCVGRIVRVKRISGQYEVGAEFVRVTHGEADRREPVGAGVAAADKEVPEPEPQPQT
jgi:hypothetical protein